MSYNGWRLIPIEYYQASFLPDGTPLIVHQVKHRWRGNRFEVSAEHYYRVEIVHKKTAAGMDAAIYSKPDKDFPEIPPWQRGWTWLGGDPGFCYMKMIRAEQEEV